MTYSDPFTQYPGMKAGTQTVRSLLRGFFLSQDIIIPQQVIVPDISFYQVTADFNQMKRNGAMGVIIRAGQNTWPDPKFATFWRDAKAAGLPRGTYFYYDSRVPPEDQADLFYDQFRGDMPEMEIIADYEESYDGAYGGWRNLQRFLERLLLRGVPASKMAIYTGYYYWRSNSPQSDPLELSYFKQFRLHLAWYTSNPGNVSIPAPWANDDLLLWQYTSTGDGPGYGVGSKGIDLNYFNGTPEQFTARYGGGTTPPDPPPVETPTHKGTVIVGALNVRTGPSTGYTVIDGLFEGDEAYGTIDPGTQWMHISKIKRVSGEVNIVDGWASALPEYMRLEKISDSPLGVELTEILANQIKSAEIVESGKCLTIDAVSGYGAAFNGTGFVYSDNACTPNMWRLKNGVSRGDEPNAWDAIAFWDNVGCHVSRYDGLGNAKTALQLKRFVIIDSQKNPAANPDWDIPAAAWNILAEGPNYETWLFTVKTPCTLNEAVDAILATGKTITRAGDLDSGRSTKVKYKDNIWQSTGDSVANFVGFSLDGGTDPPTGELMYKATRDTLLQRLRDNDTTVKGEYGILNTGTVLDSSTIVRVGGVDYLKLNYDPLNNDKRPPYAVAMADLEVYDPTTPPPSGEEDYAITIVVEKFGYVPNTHTIIGKLDPL